MRHDVGHAGHGQRRIVDGPEPVDEDVDVAVELAPVLRGPLFRRRRDAVEPRAAVLREGFVSQVALAVVDADADPGDAEHRHRRAQHAETHPVAHVPAIESLEEREHGHDERLAETGMEPGEAQADFEQQHPGHHGPPVVRDQPSQHEVEQAEPEKRDGDDRLRDRRKAPGKLVNEAGKKRRHDIRHDEALERQRVSGPHALERPQAADQVLSEQQPGQDRDEAAEADEHHRLIVAAERRLERPARDGHVVQADTHGHPLQACTRAPARAALLRPAGSTQPSASTNALRPSSQSPENSQTTSPAMTASFFIVSPARRSTV